MDEEFDEVDPDFAPVNEPEKKKGPELVALDDDEFPPELEEEDDDEVAAPPPVKGTPIRKIVGVPKSLSSILTGAAGPGAPAGPATVSPLERMLKMLEDNSFSSSMISVHNQIASILGTMKGKLDITSQTSEICAKILKFINDESIIKIATFYEISSKGNIIEVAFSAIKMSGTKVSIPRETMGDIMAVILSMHDTTKPMTGYTVEFGIGTGAELVMTVHMTKWSPGNQLKQPYTILNPDLLL